jgi:hypothetical protein
MNFCDFLYLRPIDENKIAEFVFRTKKQDYTYKKRGDKCNRKTLGKRCPLHSNLVIIDNKPMFPYFVEWVDSQDVNWDCLSFLLQQELYRIYVNKINKIKLLRKTLGIEEEKIDLDENHFAEIYFGFGRGTESYSNSKAKETECIEKKEILKAIDANIKLNRIYLTKYYTLIFTRVEDILENMGRRDIISKMYKLPENN